MANYIGIKQALEYVPGMNIHWAGGRTSPPPDTPACGFDNSLCKSNNLRVLFILFLIFFLAYFRIARIGMIKRVLFLFSRKPSLSSVSCRSKKYRRHFIMVPAIFFTYAIYILPFPI